MPSRHLDPLTNALVDVVEGIMDLNRTAAAVIAEPRENNPADEVFDFTRRHKMIGREIDALKHALPMPKCEDTTPLQKRIEMWVTNGVGYCSRIDPQNLHHKFCYDPEEVFYS